LAQQLIRAGIEPVDLPAPGPAGVRDDERVPLAGLGLARVQVRCAAHYQARDIRHRYLPADGDRQRELGDRARLLDHQAEGPVLAGPVNKRLQRSLVVGHPAAEYPFPGVENVREVVLLTDIQAGPHVHLLRSGHPCRSLIVSVNHPVRPSMVRTSQTQIMLTWA
jgi:hypothetical protein